jgi:hypothetical protein
MFDRRVTVMLATLPPDIFPIIASHLPLYHQPSTLLKLALTNRRLKEIIVPHLLYQHVRLDGKERALQLLGTLKGQAHKIDEECGGWRLGRYVRRLYVSSDLPKGIRASSDTVTLLRALIDLGGLPNLVSFTLHATCGWYVRGGSMPVHGFHQLDASFWDSLKEKCPSLKEISLSGVMDLLEYRWAEGYGLFKYKVSSFVLH